MCIAACSSRCRVFIDTTFCRCVSITAEIWNSLVLCFLATNPSLSISHLRLRQFVLGRWCLSLFDISCHYSWYCISSGTNMGNRFRYWGSSKTVPNNRASFEIRISNLFCEVSHNEVLTLQWISYTKTITAPNRLMCVHSRPLGDMLQRGSIR